MISPFVVYAWNWSFRFTADSVEPDGEKANDEFIFGLNLAEQMYQARYINNEFGWMFEFSTCRISCKYFSGLLSSLSVLFLLNTLTSNLFLIFKFTAFFIFWISIVLFIRNDNTKLCSWSLMWAHRL